MIVSYTVSKIHCLNLIQKDQTIDLLTLMQEMETDDDHAPLSENSSLIQDILFIIDSCTSCTLIGKYI